MKKPLVSVIINCYNGERYLSEAIESVLSQTYDNWEIIFWDNQSKDSSADLFKSYDHPRLKYYYASRHTNLGKARNLAVEKANGQWIAFLDYDDMWFPSKLEKQIKIIQLSKENLGLVYGRVKRLIMDDVKNTRFAKKYEKKRIKNLRDGMIFNKLLINNFVPLSTALILKEGFYKVGRINQVLTYAEDYDLFLKIARKYKVAALNEDCSVYRVHKNNISRTSMHIGYIESMKNINNYIPNPYAIIGLSIYMLKLILHSAICFLNNFKSHYWPESKK